MSLHPYDWSVVIVGRWNPTILTPARIAKYIFKMEGDPARLEIGVPIDGVEPYQVKHPEDNIIVMADDRRLRIILIKMDYPTLDKAKSLAINALNWLPYTPLSAAGFNVRFQTTDYLEKLDELTKKDDIDEPLIRLYSKIADRSITRMLDYKNGKINLVITSKNGGYEVLFNFHQDSDDKDKLIEWLNTPIKDVASEVDKILKAFALNISDMEVSDDNE